MNDHQEINSMISKEEHKNIYLTETLRELTEQVNHKKQKHPNNENIDQQRFKEQVRKAQVRNIEKRIEIYQRQIEQLSNLSTKTVIEEIKAAKTKLTETQLMRDKQAMQIEKLEGEIAEMRKKDHSNLKNKRLQGDFQAKQFQILLLKKRLQQMKQISDPNIRPSLKNESKKHKSSLGMAIMVEPEDIPKNKKLDQYALYKNLIRFYTAEEEKLRAEVESMQSN